MANIDYIPKTAKLKPLKGVEVFAVGNWNGMEFSEVDLAKIQEAFEPTLKEVHPVIVTNHGDDKDGGLNRGFVVDLRLNPKPDTDYLGGPVLPGQRLEADLLVDEQLFEDIEQGRYLRPSIELWPEYKSKKDGTVYPWVCTAISYQGGKHIEAVRTLRPVSIDMQDQEFTPLHFSHGGHAVVFSTNNQQGTLGMVDKPMDNQAPADPMQALTAMMSQLLEFQKSLSADLGKIGASLELLAKKEAEEPEMEGELKAAEGYAKPEEMTQKPEEMAADPEKDKKLEMSDLKRKFADLEKQLFAERKARKDEASLADAKEFVMARSNEKCLKVPVKFRDRAINLIAFAPSDEYKASVKELIEASADRAVMFADKTRQFHEETVELVAASGPVAAIEAKVNKLMSDKLAADRAEAYKLIFKENPHLYNEYRAAQNRAQ